MVRRIEVWIVMASFLVAGLPASASADLRRRAPRDWIDDVIPAHQVKPGSPTPHSLIAMQAQAWAMRQTPKRTGFGSPFGLLPEWMDWDRIEVRGIVLSGASLENIAGYLGISVDQIARIEGVDVPGFRVMYPIDQPPSFDEILVRVSLEDGTAYLGILDKERTSEKYREPVYQVRSLRHADEVTDQIRKEVADHLKIDPGRIQRIEIVSLEKEGDLLPQVTWKGGDGRILRGRRLGLSVELDDGTRYIGRADGWYSMPIPIGWEPIEPRLLPPLVGIVDIYSLTPALALAIPTDSHPDVANVHVIARYLGLHSDQIRSVQFVPERGGRGGHGSHPWRHRSGRFTVLVDTDKGELLGVVTGRIQRDGRLRVREILSLNAAEGWKGYFGKQTLRNVARYLGVSPREIASIQVASLDPHYYNPNGSRRAFLVLWPPRQLAVLVTLMDGTRFLGVLQIVGSWRLGREAVYRVRFLREIEPNYPPDPWMPIIRPYSSGLSSS